MRLSTQITLWVTGLILVLFGVVGLILPLHPGLFFIVIGLGVLSGVSPWAGRLRAWVLDRVDDGRIQSDLGRRWRRRVESWLPEPAHEATDPTDEGQDADPHEAP